MFRLDRISALTLLDTPASPRAASHRVDLSRGIFQPDPGDPLAVIEEFRQYGMNITPAGRMTYSAPEGEHDDVVTAKMLSHWGCINEGFGELTALPAPTGAPSADSEGDDPDSFDEVKTLEWALGQFVVLVEHKSWFAMNSLLNKLHDLSSADA